MCAPLSPQTDLDLVTRGLNMAKVAQRRSEKVVPGRSPGLHLRILARGAYCEIYNLRGGKLCA